MNQIVKLNDEEIVLDLDHLVFSEETLNNYLQKSGVWYSYYTQKLQKAELLAWLAEDAHDRIYSACFREHKTGGVTDKLAESLTKCDERVIAASEEYRMAKHKAGKIDAFVKSLDRAMRNALNLGYNVRKEMDKLGLSSVRYKSVLDEALGE